MLRRIRAEFAPKDFDAWAYNIWWPQDQLISPLTGKVDFVVEDIKFAYNAWCLLRLAMFFGVRHPKILSNMVNTTPSMDIMLAGNRLFYMHSRVEAQFAPDKVRIALTPNHPRAFPIQKFSWLQHCTQYRPGATGVELVLGMENGLSPEVADACDHCTYIPQYGSIGSLSMLSALAIAAHTMSRSLRNENKAFLIPDGASTTRSSGHMPLSRNPHPLKRGLPHEVDLLPCSNVEIRNILRERRQMYDLQMSVMMYNELGDRNIGAVIRNANAFNCEYVVIINRRRFNRRGAVGTQKVLDVRFFETVYDDEARTLLDDYEVWLLYPYYPNLLIYDGNTDMYSALQSATFLRHGDPLLCAWRASQHRLTAQHPLLCAHPRLAADPVYLDDDESLTRAVQKVKEKKLRGIILAVPEEGSSPHPSLRDVCHRVVYVSDPTVLPHATQRGLNPALSTAISFERIRSAIDALHTL
ncbi:hypothetical protein ABB37_05812 [Leptomonas pyrrhocoris]|uniref:tRNA/rRNA methyltransferase SpoU type domain-containing protein n=1 Tax=Leptomonas pyrrhocoris TaxID=157538 RepID=A0A0N0DUU6_LEPPY|nr:hypothetical protein ABB37_05812 [Leptomonas pyrrhocoris]KPA79372.1 hypothetical protein ABB37_05812 [Leptomonas pyrrhocoris]|eukprot:XP_015657811.1 hypothetical protein ABB37_05812 [Leptomonas pyrrhocoris]